MLSDREREQLDAIEQALMADDRRLAAALTARTTRPRRRWPLRTLLGFGVFLLVIAVVTAPTGCPCRACCASPAGTAGAAGGAAPRPPGPR